MIKLPAQLRAEFKGYAQLHGRSVSELLRRMMEDEMRSQRMSTAMKPPLIESRYGKAAPITGDDGKVYHLQLVSFQTQPHLMLYDPEEEYRHIPSAWLKDTSPILARLHGVLQAGYRWETDGYRRLCLELGLDPDHGRPTYRPEDRDIVARLEDELDKAPEGWKLTEFIRGLLGLLRTDHFPELRTFENCQATLQNWTFKRSKAVFQDAFDRVETDRIASSETVFTGIDFLPSWEGEGYTASIYLWGSDCAPDGWSQDLYGHVRGVAVQPVHQERVTDTVVKRLSEQGVVFLTLEEARTYMDGEGAYWAFRKGNPNCPAGIDSREPTPTEKLRWRIRRPATPLFDQYGKQPTA